MLLLRELDEMRQNDWHGFTQLRQGQSEDLSNLEMEVHVLSIPTPLQGLTVIISNCDHIKERIQCLMASRCLRGGRHATRLVQGLSQIFLD